MADQIVYYSAGVAPSSSYAKLLIDGGSTYAVSNISVGVYSRKTAVLSEIPPTVASGSRDVAY